MKRISLSLSLPIRDYNLGFGEQVKMTEVKGAGITRSLKKEEKMIDLTVKYPETREMSIYYSDFRDFKTLSRNLLFAILDGWVRVSRRTKNFITVVGAEDVLASLFEENPGWLKVEEQA